MAYFPNGAAGEYLDNQCAECIHEDRDALCPVASVQSVFNYSQLKDGNRELKRAMGMLINKEGDCQVKVMIDKYYERRSKYKPSKGWGDK